MDYVLLTAATSTRAGQMMQYLQQHGVSAGVTRLPTGLSKNGCAFAVRISADAAETALQYLRGTPLEPRKVFKHEPGGFREVTI